MTAARSEWMLYGAYGRTGRLVLDEALRRGQRPVLAGRDGTRLGALGRSTGLTTRSVALEDRAGMHAGTPVQAFGAEFALLVPDTRIQEL
jgi:short subunit dehydrogenase-like uncharacterized protein